MAQPKNILFIMFDQLRWDYLSCYGHPHLKTPHLDRLASRGVRFNRAYVQSPLCGPSRMSTYTGRYVHNHGATWNKVPLKVGEKTMGDHLREVGMDCWLVGKTHMTPDTEGMARLGIAPDSAIGKRISECGFDVFERDDGMRPEGPDGLYDPRGTVSYNAYLRARGYDGDNPWHDYANSTRGEDGTVQSGWFLDNADKPANIRLEDSETPYMTRRGMDFIAAQGDRPWCCHLSYIKPHWPYIAPDPYASMFGPQDFLPRRAGASERGTGHPVFRGFQNAPICQSMSRDDVRDKVLRAYMGLVKQCDDQMGALFKWLEDTGRMSDTMIVVTADHGDFLGDHWMGEKTFFHDCAVKVPLIIYDPAPEADATRGTVSEALVESIDLPPTFLEAAGGDPATQAHWLQGQSLLPLLRGGAAPKRDIVVCEYDFTPTPLAERLGLDAEASRIIMVADQRWKMIHFESGHRPMLFDLADDPHELTDLGDSPDHSEVVADLYAKLNAWARRPGTRTTMSHDALYTMRGKSLRRGVLLGPVTPDDVSEEVSRILVGRKVPDMTVP